MEKRRPVNNPEGETPRPALFYTRVTPSGGLEVDGRKLFRDPKVQALIRAIHAIPVGPAGK